MADTQIVCRASYLSKDKAVPSLLAPLRRQVFHEKLLHFLNWFQGSYLRHVLDKNHTFDAKSNSTVPALPLADATRPLSISSKLLTIFGLFCADDRWLIICVIWNKKIPDIPSRWNGVFRFVAADVAIVRRLGRDEVDFLVFSSPDALPLGFWQESGRHFAVWTEEE